MARAGILAVVAALLVLGTSHSDDLQAQSPAARFRGGVDLVSLSVTVMDGAQRHITDLEIEDFTVLEEGIPQQVTFFRKADVRLALALLVDSSASMEQALPTAQEAAIGFVGQLAPADVATVIDFDSRVQVLADFTSDRTVLEDAIRQTNAGGSTSLYNSVYIALRELGRIRLEDEQEGLRRRVIVLLSDGEDTSSLVSFDEVADASARSDTVIYTIGLGIGDTAGRRTFQDASFVLRRFAQQTGGRAFFPAHAKELTPVYREIRDELSSQYLLAYVSSTSRRGQWRRIAVRLSRPGLMVRTREGYFAGS